MARERPTCCRGRVVCTHGGARSARRASAALVTYVHHRSIGATSPAGTAAAASLAAWGSARACLGVPTRPDACRRCHHHCRLLAHRTARATRLRACAHGPVRHRARPLFARQRQPIVAPKAARRAPRPTRRQAVADHGSPGGRQTPRPVGRCRTRARANLPGGAGGARRRTRARAFDGACQGLPSATFLCPFFTTVGSTRACSPASTSCCTAPVRDVWFCHRRDAGLRDPRGGARCRRCSTHGVERVRAGLRGRRQRA